MREELVWPSLRLFPERNVAQAVRRVARREHCELIYLSKVAKSLEAEEQAGYHQRAAPNSSVPLPAFHSAPFWELRAPVNAQVTMPIFLLMITMIPLSQHEQKTFWSLRLLYIFCPELGFWTHRMPLPVYRRNNSFGNVSLHFAIPTAFLAKFQTFLDISGETLAQRQSLF